MRARRARNAAVAADVTEALSGLRFTARSDRGDVTAHADQHGRVGAIEIGRPLTRMRAGDLGTQVTQAVSRVRTEAADTIRAIVLARWPDNGLPAINEADGTRWTVTHPVDAGLGSLTMNDDGTVTSVDLDDRAMRTMRADRVAGLIVAAIDGAHRKRATAGRAEARS
jgi:hypothetical protein